ncbi:odorant receptor 49b-like isoform X2 [Ceratina calcarata]|uniref:Odorant receptor n=1 Tax=Ceratina calcarata TaxID=156304 RepID=A0AAJ7W8W0_9HYME|nr:odorant receptor 49b-like isoform X2 [Ceratina calcarata]
MDRVKSDYYKFSTAVLSGIGLWPNGNTNIQRFQIFVIIIAFSVFLIIQFISMATQHYTVSGYISCVSPLSLSLGFFFKYLTFLIKSETIWKMSRDISYDWVTVENDEEVRILTKYAYRGDRFGKMFAYIVWIPVFIGMTSHFSAEILDFLFPLNASRPHNYPFPLEYPGDREKYFYPYAIYVDFTFFVGCTTFVGTEALSTMYMHHVISLLKIVSYRIENAISDSTNGSQKCLADKGKEGLIKAIVLHTRVIKFTKLMEEHLSVSYTLLLICGVIALSVNLFWSISGVDDQMLIPSTCILTIFIYMFYMNYLIQDVNDGRDDIFTALYNSEWYRTPVTMQKLLLFIMLKTLKGEIFNLLVVFTPSFEGFATLVNTSVSYFMVMYSIQ